MILVNGSSACLNPKMNQKAHRGCAVLCFGTYAVSTAAAAPALSMGNRMHLHAAVSLVHSMVRS
jgi:hypothetical protein